MPMFMGHMEHGKKGLLGAFRSLSTELAVFPALVWQSSAHVLHINTWAEAFNLFGTNMKCIYTWKSSRTVYNYFRVQKKK